MAGSGSGGTPGCVPLRFSKVTSLMSCSIRQASSAAICGSAPALSATEEMDRAAIYLLLEQLTALPEVQTKMYPREWTQVYARTPLHP